MDKMQSPVKKTAIIGLGLIGGSLARAMRRYFSNPPYIHAIDTNESALSQAMADGVIDSRCECLDAQLSDCEIVFVCVPVNMITSVIAEVMRFAPPECIITDTGSTKGGIFNFAAETGVNYIGGHPMAGSESAGYAASKEFLFENAYYLLTPAPMVTDAAIDRLTQILTAIRAYPIVIDAHLHDSAVAAVSHIPHIIAAALVNTVSRLDDTNKTMHTIAAGGFRDLTRIASSEPDMWSAICSENKDKILDGLAVFKHTLKNFENSLKNGVMDMPGFFQDAKDYRDSFEITGGAAYRSEYRIFVDVCDTPGVIATVATHLSVNNINIKNIGIVNSREYTNGVMQIVFETAGSMEKSINLLEGMNFTIYR